MTSTLGATLELELERPGRLHPMVELGSDRGQLGVLVLGKGRVVRQAIQMLLEGVQLVVQRGQSLR